MERIRRMIDDVMARKDVQVEENGEVILAGKIADTMPQQYCWELFKPLSEAEISQLAEGYRNAFPEALKDFYRMTNGAFLFGRHISIYGMPLWSANYKQPMALAFADGHRTKGCPKERLFFASYNTEPETQLFFDTREASGAVYAAQFGSNDVIAQWSSMVDWFVSEYEKYAGKYEQGEYVIEEIVKGVLQEIKFGE